VLVAEHRTSGTSKLQVKWEGQRRFASVESDYVFVVEHLLTKGCSAARTNVVLRIVMSTITVV
jgi:hypothetical protein